MKIGSEVLRRYFTTNIMDSVLMNQAHEKQDKWNNNYNTGTLITPSSEAVLSPQRVSILIERLLCAHVSNRKDVSSNLPLKIEVLQIVL